VTGYRKENIVSEEGKTGKDIEIKEIMRPADSVTP
jgi:hypothetical protein